MHVATIGTSSYQLLCSLLGLFTPSSEPVNSFDPPFLPCAILLCAILLLLDMVHARHTQAGAVYAPQRVIKIVRNVA